MWKILQLNDAILLMRRACTILRYNYSITYSQTVRTKITCLHDVFRPSTLPCNVSTFLRGLQLRTTSLPDFPYAIMIGINHIHNFRSNFIFLNSDDVVAIFHPKFLEQGCGEPVERKREIADKNKYTGRRRQKLHC